MIKTASSDTCQARNIATHSFQTLSRHRILFQKFICCTKSRHRLLDSLFICCTNRSPDTDSIIRKFICSFFRTFICTVFPT